MVSGTQERDAAIDTGFKAPDSVGTIGGKEVVVTTPDRVAIQPYVEPDIKPNRGITLRRNGEKKPIKATSEVELLPGQIEDEYKGEVKVRVLNKTNPIFDLGTRDSDGKDVIIELGPQLQKEFDFLSRTKGLEIGTFRCNMLQKIADDMVSSSPKWKGNVQVVIMTKGEIPEAMAYPDGTIFISQSLIDILDSLDEVAAIIGHEVSHLLNETSFTASKSEYDKGNGLGVKWFHEMLSDFGSADLLNRTGFQTLAIAHTLEKMKVYFSNSRGYEHQSQAMRAIQQYMEHTTRDFENSNKKPTPLPVEFLVKAKPTNLEIATKLMKTDDINTLGVVLRKLHPRELRKFFNKTNTDQTFSYTRSIDEPISREAKEERFQKVRDLARQIVSERLREFGFSELDTKIVLISLDEQNKDREINLNDFASLEEIISLLPILEKKYKEGEINLAMIKLFDINPTQNIDPLLEIVSWINKRMFKDNLENFLKGETNVINLINQVNKIIYDTDSNTSNEDLDYKHRAGWSEEMSFYGITTNLIGRAKSLQFELNTFVFRYVKEVVLKEKAAENKVEKLTKFLSLLRDNKFDFRATYKSNEFYGLNDPETRQLFNEIHKNIFNKEIFISPSEEVGDLPTFEEFEAEIYKLGIYQFPTFIQEFYKNYKIESGNEITKERFKGLIRQLIDKNLNQSNSITDVELYYYFEDVILKEESEEVRRKWSNGMYGSYKELKFDKARDSIHEIIKLWGNPEEFEKKAQDAKRYKTFVNVMKWITEGCNGNEEMVFELLEYYRTNSENKLNLSNYTVLELQKALSPLLGITNDEEVALYGNGFKDFDRLYNHPYIQELINRPELQLHFNSLEELNEYQKNSKYWLNKLWGESKRDYLFSDSMQATLTLISLRSELDRLTQPGTIKISDYKHLIDVLKDLFPFSSERSDLIKKMQISYLKDPRIEIGDKIIYFADHYKELGVEGAVIVGDQITDIKDYLRFRKLAAKQFKEYSEGKIALDRAVDGDLLSTELVKNSRMLLGTSTNSLTDSIESSTNAARSWLKQLKLDESKSAHTAIYNKESKKVVVISTFRSNFRSFVDYIKQLKDLSPSQRLLIATKAMGDTGGLMSNKENRALLLSSLKSGLKLSNPFFIQILEKGILGKYSSDILTAAASKMLAPLLFSGLSVDSVKEEEIKTETRGIPPTLVYPKEFTEDLSYILRQKTRDLISYGLRYKNQPNSVPAIEAVKNGILHDKIISNIKSQVEIISPSTKEETETKSGLPVATEAIIQAGESSAIFVRAMQMAVQVMDFNPAIRERLAKTQDSMVSQTKLGFWDNLLRRTQEGEEEYDPDFAKFMKEQFISLDEYLGGGSLFTTYAATIKGKDGVPEKVVLKMLNPNAEAFVEEVYQLSSKMLRSIIETNKGETRDQAKMALTLLDLSYTWCLEDINDANYIESDDMFRDTIDSFNESVGTKAIEASERIFTSKKIKVEVRSKGNTLNTLLLEKTGIEPSTKKFLIQRLSQFFDFQFIFAHKDKATGKPIYKFHSDPHAGNYMSNVQEGGTPEPLGVIDRSMYIDLNEAEKNIFSLLKEGKGSQFVSEFINLCLDKNGLNPTERLKVKNNLRVKLALEQGKQKANHKENTSKFLEIIMSEFIKFGEKFSYNPDLPKGELLEEDQAVIKEKIPKDRKVEFLINYFKKMPNRNSIRAYEDLKKDPVFQEFKLTFEDFTKALTEMTDQGLLSRKAIDVPIKYRLMIRNIVAMQNLRKRFLS